MNRNIQDLSVDELKQVFENNHALQNDVFEDLQESTFFWITEYLDCFNREAMDYSFSGYYDYLNIKDYKEFLEGLKTMQYMYCVLPESENEKINYALSLYDRYYNLNCYANNYWKNEERLLNRIESIANELSKKLYKEIESEIDYTYGKDAQLDYFLEFYHLERMPEDCYIDENYGLFEHIEYIKSYA